MSTLKEIRLKYRLSQADIAKKLNTTIPTVSLYENGQMLPPLEDMVILDRVFANQVNWADNYNQHDKREIVQGLTTLFEKYPVTAVLNFAQKAIREGTRLGRPYSLVKFYADASINEEPLLPPEVYKSKSKQ